MLTVDARDRARAAAQSSRGVSEMGRAGCSPPSCPSLTPSQHVPPAAPKQDGIPLLRPRAARSSPLAPVAPQGGRLVLLGRREGPSGVTLSPLPLSRAPSQALGLTSLLPGARAQFVDERAQLEREYATKLQAITKKAVDRKAKRGDAVWVGEVAARSGSAASMSVLSLSPILCLGGPCLSSRADLYAPLFSRSHRRTAPSTVRSTRCSQTPTRWPRSTRRSPTSSRARSSRSCTTRRSTRS